MKVMLVHEELAVFRAIKHLDRSRDSILHLLDLNPMISEKPSGQNPGGFLDFSTMFTWRC